MMSAAYTELYTHLHWLQRESLYYQMLCKDLVYPHLMSSHRLILIIYIIIEYMTLIITHSAYIILAGKVKLLLFVFVKT